MDGGCAQPVDLVGGSCARPVDIGRSEQPVDLVDEWGYTAGRLLGGGDG